MYFSFVQLLPVTPKIQNPSKQRFPGISRVLRVFCHLVLWLRSAPPTLIATSQDGFREEGRGREGYGGGEAEGERAEYDLGDLVTDELLQLGNLLRVHLFLLCLCPCVNAHVYDFGNLYVQCSHVVPF